jgi:ATP-dependent Clp protease ATP-binding subunit ClpA
MDEGFPLTAQMQRTMERAAASSRSNDQNFVGTEHVLLALLDDPDGVAGLVFNRLDVAEGLRREVTRIMDSDGYRSPG